MSRIFPAQPIQTEDFIAEAKKHQLAVEKLKLETHRKAKVIEKKAELAKEKAFIKEASLAGFNAKQAKFIYSKIMLNRDYYSQAPGSYVFRK